VPAQNAEPITVAAVYDRRQSKKARLGMQSGSTPPAPAGRGQPAPRAASFGVAAFVTMFLGFLIGRNINKAA